jgi:hypothetical protein
MVIASRHFRGKISSWGSQGGTFAVAAWPKIGQFLKHSMTSSPPAPDENLGWLRALWERG